MIHIMRSRARRKRLAAYTQEVRDLLKAGLSRRELLKLGLLSGSAILFKHGLGGRFARADEPSSPPTTPFVEALPIPKVKGPTAALSPAPNLDIHQLYDELPAKKFYDLRVKQASHSFHRELPNSLVWGYDGRVPGPTFRARYGQPILVRIRNELPANHVGFGSPEIVTHLHNFHTANLHQPPDKIGSDGFPSQFYPSDEFPNEHFRDHHYVNHYAGFLADLEQGVSKKVLGDAREALGTLWYHDHRLDFTAQNVYRGLAGFYLLFDSRDPGNEANHNPGLGLPSGAFDVPLVFADLLFDGEGELFFDPFNLDGLLGDKFAVNGKIEPYFKVARRRYRFRFLDAGPSRFYEFFLSNGQPFCYIASDGNLLPKPIKTPSVRLGVAERADVIIDFSDAALGEEIFLVNRLEQVNGRGPTGRLLSPGTPVLKFVVNRDAADRSRSCDELIALGKPLRVLPPIPSLGGLTTRTWRFDRRNGMWTVNNELFDATVSRATINKGAKEVWVFQNNSGGWSHPIHIHFEEFQILSRTGGIEPQQQKLLQGGRKDMVRLGPNETVRVFIQFRDFVGDYPMHCHNTVHEDHAMMIRFDIVE